MRQVVEATSFQPQQQQELVHHSTLQLKVEKGSQIHQELQLQKVLAFKLVSLVGDVVARCNLICNFASQSDWLQYSNLIGYSVTLL